jgi:ATP-dependent 26S proteasome regulatory subunit
LLHCYSESAIESICQSIKGYSGADIHALCKEACFGPIRSVTDIRNVNKETLRPTDENDFKNAVQQVSAQIPF